MLVHVLGVIQPPTLFVSLVGKPFEWGWLLPAGIALLAHLTLEPLGLCRGSRGKLRHERSSLKDSAPLLNKWLTISFHGFCLGPLLNQTSSSNL